MDVCYKARQLCFYVTFCTSQGESQETSSGQNARRDSTALQTTNLLTTTHRDFFSNISSDLNGLAVSTSSMFSDLFGSKGEQD